MGTEAQYCRNCRARISGEYCSECGQREGEQVQADGQVLALIEGQFG